MATQEKTWNVANRLHSLKDSDNPEVNHIIAGADEIYDDEKGAKQSDINAQTDAALVDRYTKAETYSKEQLDSLITTPDVEYVTVATFADLPQPGEANTIYRVSSYDGTQVDASKYALYAWNGATYQLLTVRSAVGEVFDVSEYNSGATYETLTAALAAVPASVQRGGMSIKFILRTNTGTEEEPVYHDEYVQYRLMNTDWSTVAGDWQGVDSELIAGSRNLVESGVVHNELALGAVYDVSAKNPTAGPNNDGKFESLSALLSDANLNTLIPTSVRRGGMSIKFIQSSDNNYIQFRLMADEFSTTVSDWQGVDSKITDGSKNLIESGNVAYNFNSVGGELGDEIVGTSESENFEWAFFPCGIKKGETYIFRNGSAYAAVLTGNIKDQTQYIDVKELIGGDIWVFKATEDASFLMVYTKSPNTFSFKKQENIQNTIALNSNECIGEWKSVFNETSYQVSVTSLFKQTDVVENGRYRITIKGNYTGKFAVYNISPVSIIYQTAESTDFSGGVTFDIVIPLGCNSISFRTWETLTLDVFSLSVLRADVSVSGIAFNKDILANINIKGTSYPIKSNISSLDFIKANANIGTFDNIVNGWITGGGVLENYGNSGYYHAVLKVKPNDVVDIAIGDRSTVVFVAKSYSFMIDGSSIDYSTVAPFNDKIVITSSDRLVMPSDAAYLVIDAYSAGNSYLPSKILINGVDALAPINNRIATASPWGGKKIAFLGDSFVARALEPQYYSVVNNVIAMTNCLSVNYGVAGTGFQREYDASSHRIPDRVTSMAGTEDAVVVIGMVNDYYYNIPLGTVSDAVSGDTFCAGVKLTIENLLAKYPSKPICFIPNSRVGKEVDNVVQMYLVNNGGVSGSEYIEKMKECCELYAIPFFDLYNTCGFNVENIEIFTDDLIHPNEIGCQFLSRKIVSFINSI